ncbi:MAG: metallophosphoesterase, partial [Pseudomonadota bacterium]
MRQFFSSIINRIAHKELENSGYKAITATIKKFRPLRGTKISKEHINHTLRQRVSLSKTPQTIYAIGDVHGCMKSLKKLEQLVLNDKAQHPGNALLVMLGDYVDRGPDTRGVINHLLRPLADDIKRLCLVGNHEIMMLQA